jgi:hypothetical protein
MTMPGATSAQYVRHLMDFVGLEARCLLDSTDRACYITSCSILGGEDVGVSFGASSFYLTRYY